MRCLLLLGISLAASLTAQTTATINMNQAITSSQEGIRAARRLRTEWGPVETDIAKRDADIKTAQEALERDSKRRRGMWPFRHAMSANDKARLTHEIDVKAAAVRRDQEDARAALAIEQRRVLGDIGPRMIAVLNGYAKEHGYSLIPDSGDLRGAVLVAENAFTAEIVRLFDRAYP